MNKTQYWQLQELLNQYLIFFSLENETEFLGYLFDDVFCMRHT